MYTETIQTGKLWVAVVGQHAQRNGLKRLISLALRVINHSKVLHRRRGAVDLISALRNQPVIYEYSQYTSLKNQRAHKLYILM